MQLTITITECLIALASFSIYTILHSVERGGDANYSKTWFSERLGLGWEYEYSVNEEDKKIRKIAFSQHIDTEKE